MPSTEKYEPQVPFVCALVYCSREKNRGRRKGGRKDTSKMNPKGAHPMCKWFTELKSTHYATFSAVLSPPSCLLMTETSLCPSSESSGTLWNRDKKKTIVFHCNRNSLLDPNWEGTTSDTKKERNRGRSCTPQPQTSTS